ncbi:hypothetical protein AAZX31_12G163300 [Glycine max]
MFPSFVSFSKSMVTHDYIYLFRSPKHPELQNMISFVGVVFLCVRDKVLNLIRERGHLLIAENKYSMVSFATRLSDIRQVSFCCLFILMVFGKKSVFYLVASLNGLWGWTCDCLR